MNVRYRIDLSQIERTELRALLSSGKHASRKLKRAQILLAADAGAGDEEIARSVGVGGSTVYRIKRRFVEGNLERALSDEPRPGAERKLTVKEEALLVAHLTRAAALRALLGLRAGRGPAPAAGLAGFEPRDAQLRGHPRGGLFERHLKVVAQVGPALRGSPARACGATAEHVAEAEEVAEYVLDAAEPLRAPARARRSARDARVSEAVVARALLGIGEDGVSLSRLLELLLGLLVAGVFVRVVADCELAVSALYLRLGRAPAQAEDFVVIAFSHLQ